MERVPVISEIADVIDSRKGGDPKVSYVAKLFSKAPDAALKKVGEEATEVVMAAKDGEWYAKGRLPFLQNRKGRDPFPKSL